MSQHVKENQIWDQWCRLCAKNEPQSNTNIFSTKENSEILIRFISKHFFVDLKRNSKLPQMLCNQCFCFVNSLMKFAERVAKVQEMFHALYTADEDDYCNLDNLLQKYGLFEELPKQLLPETKVWCLEASAEKFVNENIDEPELEIKAEPSQAAPYDELEDETEMSWECANKYGNSATDSSETEQDDEEHEETSRATQIYEFFTMGKTLTTSAKRTDLVHADDTLTSNEAIDQELLHWMNNPNDFGAYNCSECTRKFKGFKTFSQHLKKNHKLAARWKCPKCTAKYYPDRRKLKEHLRVHILPLELRTTFQCKKCLKKFSSKRRLNIHNERVHLLLRNYICNICNYAFYSNMELKLHMQRHSDETPFACDICDRRFKDKTIMKRHMDTHTDERKHTCETCGFQAKSIRALKAHIGRHTSVYRHKCDFCKESFKQVYALKLHLFYHTGMTPYHCDFCDNSYSNISSMRTHRKTAHRKEIETVGPQNIVPNYKMPSIEELKTALKAAGSVMPLKPRKLEDVKKLTEKEKRDKRLALMERRAKTGKKLEKLINKCKAKTKVDEYLPAKELTEEYLYDTDDLLAET